MSSDEEGDVKLKKKNLQRACDGCRRRKVRCDGGETRGKKCSNCASSGIECCYNEAAKRRGPPKAYVEALKTRVGKLEKILHQILPEDEYELLTGPDNMPSTEEIILLTNGSVTTESPTSQYPVSPGPDSEPQDSAGSVEDEVLMLSNSIRKVGIQTNSFYGKSSNDMLLLAAMDLKETFTGNPTALDIGSPTGKSSLEFWKYDWGTEFLPDDHPLTQHDFPDDKLLAELVDLYFKHVNVFMPLLHKPTFLRQIQEEAHLRDERFATVLLLVCANASRYSDDPRVRLDGVDSWLSSGWKWFDQVQLVQKCLLSPPTLLDLQYYCLACQFLQGSSVPHACWTMVGMGIRLAQEIGAHRKDVESKRTVENELMKRAFWAMVVIDYSISAAYGRPCGIQEEDFDLEMPIECDDEYWDHPDPAQAWRQPPGKPSTVSYFVSHLKLVKILAVALRTIYGINKSKNRTWASGSEWEQTIVSELDLALNKWVDSIPDHLRWDPHRDDEMFFRQSVRLYAEYYLVQIIVHRPFIPTPKKASPVSFPSLAICTNAARSCSHIVDAERRRTGTLSPSNLGAVFSASIVLLRNIWSGKCSGLSGDPEKEMAAVHDCMAALQTIEDRRVNVSKEFEIAQFMDSSTGGMLPGDCVRDVLYELASSGDLPLPQCSPSMSNKRERDSDGPSGQKHSSEDETSRSLGYRFGNKRARKSTEVAQPLISLPTSSHELGRLPIHGQLDYALSMDWVGDTPADGNWGYWFTEMDGIPNANGTDFPSVVDAQFFDQLASMSWPDGAASAGFYHEDAATISGNTLFSYR